MQRYREGHIVLSSGVPVRIKEMWVTPGMWIVEYKNGDTVGVAETDLEPAIFPAIREFCSEVEKPESTFESWRYYINDYVYLLIDLNKNIPEEPERVVSLSYPFLYPVKLRCLDYAHEFQDLLYYAFNIEI